VFFPSSGGVYVDNTTRVQIHPDYTGNVFDDHDIALIDLGARAPDELDRYELYFDDAVGDIFEVVGFGARGQGDVGAVEPAGTRVRGFNLFDNVGGGLLPFLGVNSANTVYMFDFDNGNPANDAFGFWLGQSNPGLGVFETMTAGGDSGGPSFVDGRIAAVTSFGLTISAPGLSSDVLPGLNSSFGEFAGNTSIRANQAWLNATLYRVPEPSTWALLLIALLGFALRSRRGFAS
jgi:hypothetical protein